MGNELGTWAADSWERVRSWLRLGTAIEESGEGSGEIGQFVASGAAGADSHGVGMNSEVA